MRHYISTHNRITNETKEIKKIIPLDGGSWHEAHWGPDKEGWNAEIGQLMAMLPGAKLHILETVSQFHDNEPRFAFHAHIFYRSVANEQHDIEQHKADDDDGVILKFLAFAALDIARIAA